MHVKIYLVLTTKYNTIYKQTKSMLSHGSRASERNNTRNPIASGILPIVGNILLILIA
jgi:hypothetical protein